MTGSLLAARGLAVALAGRPVLHGIDLALAPGDLLGLIGPNGAGKTTLLRALAGLLPPTRGSVLLDGRAIGSHAARERARRLAFLPQGGYAQWPLAAGAIVDLGRLPWRGPWAGASAADRDAVRRAMAATGTEALADRPFDALSGGERARVLLARALAGEPAVLLADEPAAGLDPAHQIATMRHFRSLAEAGTAVAVVLHDLAVAARHCTRLALLVDGRIVAAGDPLAVLTPDHLARGFGVRAHIATVGGRPLIVPYALSGDGDAAG